MVPGQGGSVNGRYPSGGSVLPNEGWCCEYWMALNAIRVGNKALRTDSNNAQLEGVQTEFRGCKNRSSEIRISTPKPGRMTAFNGVRRV